MHLAVKGSLAHAHATGHGSEVQLSFVQAVQDVMAQLRQQGVPRLHRRQDLFGLVLQLLSQVRVTVAVEPIQQTQRPAQAEHRGHEVHGTLEVPSVCITVRGLGLGTRARDFVEDWDINFINPSVNSVNYWFDFYSDNSTNTVSRSSFPLTLVNGPQAGQSLIGNNNLLAMGDDNSLWLDADGSLSYYNYPTGTLEFNSTKTSFTTGPSGWQGSTLLSKVGNLIGYEEGNLYFLEGDNTVQVFNFDLTYLRTDQFRFDGDLAGHSLADVIDGRVANTTYLGWDLGPVIAMVQTSAVPEPSAFAMLGVGLVGLCLTARRQRAQASA